VYACLDAVSHTAEGVLEPESTLSRVLLSTVGIKITIVLLNMVSIILCVTDVESVVQTLTYVPSL
jgi:hypothetical protein